MFDGVGENSSPTRGIPRFLPLNWKPHTCSDEATVMSALDRSELDGDLNSLLAFPCVPSARSVSVAATPWPETPAASSERPRHPSGARPATRDKNAGKCVRVLPAASYTSMGRTRVTGEPEALLVLSVVGR